MIANFSWRDNSVVLCRDDTFFIAVGGKNLALGGTCHSLLNRCCDFDLLYSKSYMIYVSRICSPRTHRSNLCHHPGILQKSVVACFTSEAVNKNDNNFSMCIICFQSLVILLSKGRFKMHISELATN